MEQQKNKKTISKIDENFSSFDFENILQINIQLKPSKIKSSTILKRLTNNLSKKIEIIDNKCLFSVPLPLNNGGNNCYINSSMQSLLPTINRELHTALRSARNSNLPAIELFNIYIDQLEKRADSWSVVNNIRNLKYFSKNFRYGAQEDAQEFLNGLLDRLREEFEKIERFKGPNNPIGKTYVSSYDSRYYCTKCQKSNIKSPLIQEELTFFVEMADSIPSMLNSAYRTHNNNYSCEFCKTKNGSAKMNCVFTSLPKTFICCVKRFKHNLLFNGSKLNSEISFSKNIQLPYVDKENNRRQYANYELSSIVIHLGNSINSGHYECVSRIQDQWYRISDRSVRPINEVQAQMSAKSTSYIYTYTQCSSSTKIATTSSIKRKISSQLPQSSSFSSKHSNFKKHKQHNHSQPWKSRPLATSSTSTQSSSLSNPNKQAVCQNS